MPEGAHERQWFWQALDLVADAEEVLLTELRQDGAELVLILAAKPRTRAQARGRFLRWWEQPR